MEAWKLALLLASTDSVFGKYDWSKLIILPCHAPMIFYSNPWLTNQCDKDEDCPFKEALQSDKCWGYEDGCRNRYLSNITHCGDERHYQRYWNQGDFGKLRIFLDEFNGRELCKPKSGSSLASLSCTREAKMCRSKNLLLHIPSFSERDETAILVPKDGIIGSYCDLDQKKLEDETRVKRTLSTWGHHLQSFKELEFDPFDGDRVSCDVVIEKPVVFVQLDAVGNLYHHFCDFFNLYLTQHANNSWFGTDVQIIRWHESPRFRDPFMDVWKAFTDHEILSLQNFIGRKVCIPDATFAFLPRMAGGLYYSTHLEEDCRGSTMMKSFSDHILNRLDVSIDNEKSSDVIRITFLQRGGSRGNKVYRRVLNADALVKRLKKFPRFIVKAVSYDFSEMSFMEQLKITRNTDIFIGMHGAGLTHFMFLPDWAIAFELYNCGDIRCYRDLANLRGVRYMTWEDSSKVFEHDKDDHERYSYNSKFWNYSFDVEEFIRLVRKARDTLLQHSRFQHLRKRFSSGGEKREL